MKNATNNYKFTKLFTNNMHILYFNKFTYLLSKYRDINYK